jgi:AraC-like DNA-binding protein
MPEKYTLETAFENAKNRYTYLAVNGVTPDHTHEGFFEFFYIVSGGTEHKYKDRSETLLSGDAYLIRPSDCHKMSPFSIDGTRYSHRDIYVSEKDMEDFCLFASPERNLYGEIINSPSPIHFHMTYHDVRASEAQAIRLSTLSDPEAAQCYRAIVLNLLSLSTTNKSSSLYPQWLNKLLAYIQASVTRKRSLDEYIKTTGYCHEHVSREFKRFTGYRLNEYVLRTKLEYAKTLLSLGDGNSITEIAYYLGFSSESNFIAAFRKHFGTTPLQWKKSEKEKDRAT